MSYFDIGGALHKRLGDSYKPRAKQIELAGAVSDLEPGDVLFAHAPVATGKSDALAIGILESGRKGVLSTYSRSELSQIEGLVPEWREAFPDKRIVVIKGRSNYVCHRKMEAVREQLRNEKLAGNPPDKRKLNVLQWGSENVYVADGPQGVQSISGTGCVGTKECAHISSCHYFDARKKAGDADLVITTHAMVIANCRLPRRDEDGELVYWFPRGVWVADEGDCLPAAITEEMSISGKAFQSLMDDIGVRPGLRAQVDKLLAYARRACDGPYQTVNIDPKTWKAWATATKEILADAKSSYVRDVVHIAGRKAEISNNQELLEAFEGADIPDALETMIRLEGMVEALLEPTPSNGFSLALARLKKPRADMEYLPLQLSRQPISVGRQLQACADVFQRVAVVSGSMSLPGDGFEFFEYLSGLEPSETLELESPIDYKAGLRTAIEHTESVEEFCDLAVRLHRELGPTLVLTPRYSTVGAVVKAFKEAGLSGEILAQSKDFVGTVDDLAEQIRGGKYASLVGTTSCWRGLNLDGRYKNCVLIEKMPFPAPTQDLVLHAHQLRNSRTAWPVYGQKVALKLAIQGAGRTLRREGDHCLLVLADRRLDAPGVVPGGSYCSLDEGIEWMQQFSARKPPMPPKIESDVVDYSYLLEAL